jgi:hypothetical protein
MDEGSIPSVGTMMSWANRSLRGDDACRPRHQLRIGSDKQKGNPMFYGVYVMYDDFGNGGWQPIGFTESLETAQAKVQKAIADQIGYYEANKDKYWVRSQSEWKQGRYVDDQGPPGEQVEAWTNGRYGYGILRHEFDQWSKD